MSPRKTKQPLTIQKNRIVCVMHRISDPETGQILESTHDPNEEESDHDGNTFLFGRDNCDPAYESLILGCRKGDIREGIITFQPPDPDAEWEVERSKFPAEGKPGAPVQGEVMHLEDDEGPLFARVIYCDPFTLRLSTNLPFAGKTVKAWLKVLKVRTAYKEELISGFPLALASVVDRR